MSKKDTALYGVMDIETVNLDGLLYPYAAGFRIMDFLQIFHAYNNPDLDIKLGGVIKDCIEILQTIEPNKTKYIMVHNLGGFDGFFILKALLGINTFDPFKLNVLKDAEDCLIEIKYEKIIFRDSLRIFSRSLKDLAKICKTNTTKGVLDHEKVSLELIKTNDFYNESLLYLKADIESLYEIITTMKKNLLDTYGIPLYKIYSASNLAFLVYRTNYQKNPIEASS